MARKFDFIVVGAGIAGASVAAELSVRRSVVLLEKEDVPGFHSTGRSVAVFSESYGSREIRALTIGSREFYQNPPAGFSDYPLLKPRGFLFVAREDQSESLEKLYRSLAAERPSVSRLEPREVAQIVPSARKSYVHGGVYDDSAMDIDVASLHQGYLRRLRKNGGSLRLEAEVLAARRSEGAWIVDTPKGPFSAPNLVNAAGAWCDVIADLANVGKLGIVPKRRTAFVFEPNVDYEYARWPVVIDVDETFYIKPEAGRIIGSPADETPDVPRDVHAEDIDVAIGMDRIDKALDLRVKSISRKWAGLRSFFPDKNPVIGFDPRAEGFFWLAGQGGYGIQTAPRIARLAAAILESRDVDREFEALQLDPNDLGPARSLTPDRA